MIINDKILNGKALSEKLIKQIAKQVRRLPKPPGLGAILIGDDHSSHLYVNLKKKACEQCNINFHRYYFSDDYTEKEITEVIKIFNNDNEINGILVQLPLPKQYNTDAIIRTINLEKDVDCLHPDNLNRLATQCSGIISPLVLGIVELIKATKEKINNKKIVILCNNKIFGTAFRCFYGANNQIQTITLNDVDYLQYVQTADILIVALGKPKFITANMIKKDAIIIDVGINKVDGKTVGDVDLPNVLEKVKFISPVPGGVGPMTIAMLLQNLLKLQAQQNSLK